MTAEPMLSGLRILDFTRVMSGPYCTAMLADLGAQVIKVEEPREGDISRHVAPYVDDVSAYFAMLNRGKQSIALDLKDPRAIALAVDLARHCDVLVENFRPGVMDRLGLGYAAISEANPRLVYASISGFGQDGPLARLPAYDLVVQAMSGVMSITGERGGRSTAVGESVADIFAGTFASWGILAALLERNRSDRGRHVDVSMLDCMFSMLVTPISRMLATGEEPVRFGNRHPETYPCDSFSAQDGEVVLVCLGDHAFHGLARAMERPDLIDDPRFRSNADRNACEKELRKIIGDWCAARSREAVLDALRAAGVPSAPVWGFGEVIGSDHVRHRGLIKRHEQADGGPVSFVSQPVRFSDTGASEIKRAPHLGEHTGEILQTLLGLDDRTIEALRAASVIAESKRV